MLWVRNTPCIRALTCNNNSYVFFSLHRGQLFAWFLCAAHNTTPLIVWITLCKSIESPICDSCEPSLFKFNTFGHRISRPPSVSRYAGGLKMNTSKTKTLPAIYTLHYFCNQPGTIIIKYKRVACYKILYICLLCSKIAEKLTYICTNGLWLLAFISHCMYVCRYGCMCAAAASMSAFSLTSVFLVL